jgi:hypothetical protein
MRQTISGLAAAIAIVAASAAPAMACGFGFGASCVQSYVPVYSGCNTGCGGGWAYERLPDPVQQYYYVNQGPTYTGPGNFAPYPTYQEGGVSGWNGYHGYRHAPYYYGAYHARPHFHPSYTHSGYHYWGHRSIRYGYFDHHHYASHYGYHGMPHQYGYRHTLHSYY